MYAVIDIPRFALQAVSRMEEGLIGKPIALVDASLAKSSVIDCSIAAERSGVFSGLSLPQAIARCPEIIVRHQSEKAELSAGRAIFDYAYSLSPQVEETYQASVLLAWMALIVMTWANDAKKSYPHCKDLG